MRLVGFFIFRHPLINILAVIIQASVRFYLIQFIMPSILASYILFIVIVGGLLIVFRYLSALIPNELFMFKKLTIVIVFLVVLIYLLQRNLVTTRSINLILKYEEFSVIHIRKIIIILFVYILLIICLVISITGQMKGPVKKITYVNFTKNPSYY